MTICGVDWITGEDPNLLLRLRPLREQWEARGPGMLRFIQQMMPWVPFASRINVKLSHPQRGGGGRVISCDEVEFEAVLANRFPQLPEAVRLAWLILCATVDAKPAERTALVPVTLSAAEFVELARCDRPTIELALAHWIEADSRRENAASWQAWWDDTGRLRCANREAWLQSIPE